LQQDTSCNNETETVDCFNLVKAKELQLQWYKTVLPYEISFKNIFKYI